MNSKIENFWNWFEENAHEYSDIVELYSSDIDEANRLIDKVNQKLKLYSEGLSVEFGVKELIVTPRGVKQFFAPAYELVAHAPSLDEWKFRATKPALGTVFSFKMGEIEIDPEEVTFMPLESSEYPDDIAIRLYHKAYVAEEGTEQNAVILGLYSMLDTLLGEESATFDFQYIDFDDMPHPKEQDYPFESLPEFVANKKRKRKNAGEKFPEERLNLLEGKIEGFPSLLVQNYGLKYYAFTKEFPYWLRVSLTLHNIGENGLPTGNTDELYTIEDIIYNAIYKAEKGHFVATETYRGKRELFYHVDSLESIENAMSALPKELKSCTMAHYVEFDPLWVLSESYIYM